MSQNFDIGPSFDFIKCRILYCKKLQKIFHLSGTFAVFLYSMRPREIIRRQIVRLGIAHKSYQK